MASQNDEYLYICTCCRRLTPKKNNVIFHINKYNTENLIVKQALSKCITNDNVWEMICKTFHISLSKPKPTMSKHALSVHENILKNCKCIICEKEVDEKITQEFHIQEYKKIHHN